MEEELTETLKAHAKKVKNAHAAPRPRRVGKNSLKSRRRGGTGRFFAWHGGRSAQRSLTPDPD